MSDDPRAERNRGDSKGLWLLGGLAALALILVVAAVLKPTPAAPDPAAVAAQLKADQQRIEHPRPSLDVEPARTTPATE